MGKTEKIAKIAEMVFLMRDIFRLLEESTTDENLLFSKIHDVSLTGKAAFQEYPMAGTL